MASMEDKLALEEIDKNYYRSKHLYRPVKARGVFGGQVVGHALSAATHTVPPEYTVHSLHSYFVLPGDNSIPILYEVQRLRDGNTYCTRMVLAKQRGLCIFTMTCSFAVAEKTVLEHQFPMPQCPDPESLPTQQERITEWMEHPEAPEWFTKYYKTKLAVDSTPIDYRHTDQATFADLLNPDKTTQQYMWFKTRDKLPDDLALHKAVVAYASDNSLLITAVRALGVSHLTTTRVEMITSLDHSIWFHDTNFRADEWLLYEMYSPRSAAGRGLAFGRIFTRDGRLIVSVAQEGVMRLGSRAARSQAKM